MGGSDYIKLGLLVFFLALSAFFSGSETAFVALQRVRLIHMVRTGVPGAARVMKMAQSPERLLSTVLLGNNLVNTAAAALGTALVISLLDNTNTAIIIATLGVGLLLLLFGEVAPKTVAAHHAEKFAFAVEKPIHLIERLLFPATKCLQYLSTAISRLTGISGPHSLVNEQEIRSLISVGKEVGSVEPAEADMLEKVFLFGDRQVTEIMTPRREIVRVERDTSLRQFLHIYAEHQHTRFPVFIETMDNVIGLLSVKDVIRALAEDRLNYDDRVTRLLRPAHFVPETKTVRTLFAELREKGQSVAMIVDEFGGIAGLATLKQLLEVIVGPVGEEGQPIEQLYSTVDERTYLLDAGLGVMEVNEQLNLAIPTGEYQTIAGFTLERLGRIPKVGDYVDCGDVRLIVKIMDGVKVDRLEVRRLTLPSEET